jgi:hypothetical protein
MSAQISFTIPDKAVKERVSKKLKARGSTLKFLLISALEAFDRGDYDISLVPQKKEIWDDTVMTEANKTQYKKAKADFEQGVNIVSQEEIFAKYL